MRCFGFLNLRDELKPYRVFFHVIPKELQKGGKDAIDDMEHLYLDSVTSNSDLDDVIDNVLESDSKKVLHVCLLDSNCSCSNCKSLQFMQRL